MDSSEPLADNIASTPVNTKAKTKTKTTAAIAATASIPDSPQVQESPFFSYVNNLSPIEPVKAAHNIAQGFPGLNSPPLVFASPRIISLREASFLKRSRSPIQQNSHDDIKGKNVVCDQDISYRISSSPSRGLAADVHNEGEINANTEPCNSPGCVDQYLADEVECEDSVPSADMDIKQSSDIQRPSQGNLTDLKDSELESEEGQEQAEGHLNISRQSQKKLVETTSGAGSCRNKGEHMHVECLSNECPGIGSSLPADFDSHVRQDECPLIPNAESGDGGYHDNHLLSVSELSHHVQDHDCPGQNKDNASYASIENVMSDDSEACQKHRGLLRRCLQFEEATTSVSQSFSSTHATHNVIKLNLPAPVAEPTMPQNSHVTQSSSLMKMQLIKPSQSKTSSAGPRWSGNTPFTGSKQLGFGLHLNSIVSSMPIDSDATACMRQTEDYLSVQELNSKPHTNSHVLDNLKRCSHENETSDQEHETNVSNLANLENVKSFPSKEHLSIPSSGEQRANNLDKRKLNQESAESSQQFNQSSPKKKKKKTAGSNDSDGCKRCNCKKSKCLKLYCDCFAAGIYCSEPCACQGCLNRLEYEDTVHEAKQLIESRNPLAFAPKVVQNVPEIPTVNGEDGNLMTPSSARHKRGCNCKKSMCLKKYCECYQSNVGCSLGCRCEGCKNVYGRKEEYLPIERGLNKEVMNSRVLDERSCRLFHDKLEGGARSILNAEFYDLQNLTPLTPAIQYSDHGKDALKSQLLSGQHLTPTESDVSSLSSSGEFAKFLKHSQRVDVLQESRKEIIDEDSFNWQIDHDNAETRNQLVHRDAAVNNACQPTAISDISSLDDASISSKSNDLSHLSQIQLSHGSGGLLSGSSLRWRSSPMTPMGRLADTKYLEYSDSASKLHDIPEDDTPEVLKDTSTPVKSVKASSPNQKRVSPPHNHARALGSSSSGGLKSGRKFILKAVPSFPPLTPHIDSKGMANKNAASQNADGK